MGEEVKTEVAKVIDAATIRKNGKKLERRESIDLDPRGSVGKVLVLSVSQAIGQVLQQSGGLVAAFLEGKGYPKPEEWRVHITSMEFVEADQSLKITGLCLEPVE